MCRLNIWLLVFTVHLKSSLELANTPATFSTDGDPRRQSHGHKSCNTDQIEYRLTRLEVQTAEKSETVRSELRETHRRLEALEDQGNEVKTALQGLRSDLVKIGDAGQGARGENGNSKLDARIDSLAKGLQIIAGTLKVLNNELHGLRQNVSTVGNYTSTLLQHADNLVTKQYLTKTIASMKHQQFYQPIPEGLFSTPADKKQSLPGNCKKVLEDGRSKSGIYRIQPEGSSRPFMVLCDMETRGGGWTHIHNRYEGSQDFYLDWHDYKYGFGNLGGEFWLGLENIYALTGSEVNELLIELVDTDMQKASAHYTAFSIGSEVEGYAMKVLGGYSGDAGDSLIYHAGSRFSTKDLDQDSWPQGSCAQSHTGAWWYRGCDTSNLNGKYLNGILPDEYQYQGMYWADFRGVQYSLAKARMLVRPRSTEDVITVN